MKTEKTGVWFWMKVMSFCGLFAFFVCISIICEQPTHMGPAHKPTDPRERFEPSTQPTTRPLTIHDYHGFWDNQ